MHIKDANDWLTAGETQAVVKKRRYIINSAPQAVFLSFFFCCVTSSKLVLRLVLESQFVERKVLMFTAWKPDTATAQEAWWLWWKQWESEKRTVCSEQSLRTNSVGVEVKERNEDSSKFLSKYNLLFSHLSSLLFVNLLTFPLLFVLRWRVKFCSVNLLPFMNINDRGIQD